jgi:hypothetical protein
MSRGDEPYYPSVEIVAGSPMYSDGVTTREEFALRLAEAAIKGGHAVGETAVVEAVQDADALLAELEKGKGDDKAKP